MGFIHYTLFVYWMPIYSFVNRSAQKKHKRERRTIPGLDILQSHRAGEGFRIDEHPLLLQRTWVQFPVPTWWFSPICNYSSHRIQDPILAPWVRGTCVVHKHCDKNRLDRQTDWYRQTEILWGQMTKSECYSELQSYRLELNYPRLVYSRWKSSTVYPYLWPSVTVSGKTLKCVLSTPLTSAFPDISAMGQHLRPLGVVMLAVFCLPRSSCT